MTSALLSRTLIAATLLAACAAQAQLAPEAACKAVAADAAPCVYQVDPPNWWTGMPAPLLLLYGRNLQSAQFAVGSATLSSPRISANGDYALFTLPAPPRDAGLVHIRIKNAHGAVTVPFTLEPQRPARDGFAGFSNRDVMYLIMIDRFADSSAPNDGPDARSLPTSAAAVAERSRPYGWHGGDLPGLMRHLDYLESLGVTTVWITPVYANENEPDSYHGYGASSLYKVDPHYGTLADLRMLGEELHKRHMKLVLDMVPNHVGPGNPWVKDEPEPDWFHGTLAHHDKAVGEFTPLVDPHAPWRDQKDILQGWFADILPDMNQENPDVSQYLIQNAAWWVEEAGADGLRIDTFPYVERPFWHAYFAQLHALFPRLTAVGEVFNGDPVITSAFAAGVERDDRNGNVDTGLWTPFDFPTYFMLRDVLLNGKPMAALATELSQDSLYPHPERLVPFLGNHDTKRFMSMPGATEAKMELGFGILLTMRGMPQIYSGDELAMTGGDTDPANRHDFPGGFPDQQASAFKADSRTPAEQQMFTWVQSLLKLRADHPELQTGEEQVLHADADTIVYVRGAQLGSGCGTGSRVLIVANKATAAQTITFTTRETGVEGCRAATRLLGSGPAPQFAPDGTLSLNAQPGISIYLIR